MSLKNNPSLGQNWLKDRATLEAIADLACDFPESSLENPPRLCLEIGPGLGTLTSSLLKRFDKVLAVEFDTQLAAHLPKSFPGKNLEVVNQDILQFDFSQLAEPYAVAGNIPYYITTPIIEKLLLESRAEKIVLLVQKEVAEKVAALKGNSSLSLFVDNFAVASLGPVVPRALFTPAPKLDSRILILEPRPAPQTAPEDKVLEFIHRAFANPRKKLSANLAAFIGLSKSELEQLLAAHGFSPNVRPADLSLNDYASLAKTLKKR